MRRLFLALGILVLGAGSLCSQGRAIDQKALQAKLKMVTEKVADKVAEKQPPVSVTTEAKKYLAGYYERTNFSDPQWVRVRKFMQWLTSNEERLNAQFSSAMQNKWESFSAEKKEVVLGAWLGMKYAIDQIGRKPEKTFPISLSQEIWDSDCGDYADKGIIYCSKGNFVEKVNIGLHEATHLLPNVGLRYGYVQTSYSELYAVVAQQRYGLPIKNKANLVAGTRTFLPAYQQTHSVKLLHEYAEGIAALIDYDAIWGREWSSSENNSNELLEMRLRSEVYARGMTGGSDQETSDLYSPAVGKYFHSTGKIIADKYCQEFLKSKETDDLDCMDEHAEDILKIVVTQLRPLVSRNIPPVPQGYI